jgi:hypothetical protein
LTARDPGAHPFLELALATFALGGFGAPALDVLDRLSGALGFAGSGAVLGRLDQFLGGQRQLLMLGTFPLLRLRSGGVALRAALVRPATRLVHRGPAFVHTHASARYLRHRGFDILSLSLGFGLLGRSTLLARPCPFSGRLGPFLMARRLLLVGRA